MQPNTTPLLSKVHLYTIDGEAIPQGSKTVAQGGGKVWLRDSNPKLKAWRESVTDQVKHFMTANQFEPFEKGDAIRAVILFKLPKPKTVARELPTVKPDLDKLIRSIFDSLTAAGVWVDDSQVVQIQAGKIYCKEGDTPNVIINLHKSPKSMPILDR